MFANGCYQRICFIDPSRSILHFGLEAVVRCGLPQRLLRGSLRTVLGGLFFRRIVSGTWKVIVPKKVVLDTACWAVALSA
jgi:hypothetical protein